MSASLAKVDNLKEEDDTLTFTLSNVDVCYANAVRRTILADIPILVFQSTPYEQNKVNILQNTSQMPNEIIKHRLSCIPICNQPLLLQHAQQQQQQQESTPVIIPLLLEINVENNTDTELIITSKDFKIKNIQTNEYLSDTELKSIFPPFIPANSSAEYYIEFLHLRPRISETLPGEKFHCTAEFSVATAKQNASFNVAGTCSYRYTPNEPEIAKQEEQFAATLKDTITPEELELARRNWRLLDGQRIAIANSFDFIIQSDIGIFENEEIVEKACAVLLKKLLNLHQSIQGNKIKIQSQKETTLAHCYDITLENEDYTIGNILNHELYETFYENSNRLSFIAFKKIHPHDNFSTIRIAFNTDTHTREEGAPEMKGEVLPSSTTTTEPSVDEVKQILTNTIERGLLTIESISKYFGNRQSKR